MGDSIPDIVQSDGNNLNIYSGSKNTEGGVTFASQSSVNNIPNLSYNTTSQRASGISISPSGGVAQVTPGVDKEGNITGMTTKTTATPSASAGATITEGSSISSSGFTDINGDGLLDHVLRIPGVGIYWKKNITGQVHLL